MLKSCEEHNDCIVVYDTQYCPVCGEWEEKLAEIEDLQNSIEVMNE